MFSQISLKISHPTYKLVPIHKLIFLSKIEEKKKKKKKKKQPTYNPTTTIYFRWKRIDEVHVRLGGKQSSKLGRVSKIDIEGRANGWREMGEVKRRGRARLCFIHRVYINRLFQMRVSTGINARRAYSTT